MPAQYELFHVGVNTVDNKTTGYPKTITPFKDNDFSEKPWPEGYADIDPYLSYRDFFNGVADLSNPEIIFSRGYNVGNDPHTSLDAFVTHQMPNSLNGFNCHGLTQKMVDAYYMKDGSDVSGKDSESNGGDGSERHKGWTTNARGEYPYTKYPPLGQGVSMQYADREPRFYACVAFNGSYWWNADPDKSSITCRFIIGAAQPHPAQAITKRSRTTVIPTAHIICAPVSAAKMGSSERLAQTARR